MSGHGNRVDVIVPTRNRPLLTPETVASVQAQSFTDWHLYVVDDHSTDETPAILDRLAAGDDRITVLRRTDRGGGNPARQTALAASSAPLVATCDSDDLWEPEKLERQVARWDDLAARGEDVGIVSCWHIALNADGAQRGPAIGPRRGRRWHPFTQFNTSTPLIARSLLEAAGGFTASTSLPLRTTDHVELFVRLTRAHEIETVPEVLVSCRHHDGERNSHGERTPQAAEEAESLLGAIDHRLDDRAALRAWLHAWVASRFLETGDDRRARPFARTALTADGPRTAVRIASHYGPWALRELVRHRRVEANAGGPR